MVSVDKIFHIADIHVRNYKRHNEYNRVFEKLYKSIKESKTSNSIILLAGDIVHSKTDVSPELYNVVQMFLKNLASLCTVVIIPGNHDTNLNNSTRLDALTPIIDAISDSNLHYIKNSEIFSIGDINFYHWSVFDKKKDYPTIIKSKKKSICLFHGVVNNASSDQGVVLHSHDMEVADFNGFDYVMLGDIHRFQYLNEEKTIAYPGSLIQQNHGESINGHGYILWDLETRKSQFIEIKNDTSFLTLKVENSISNLDCKNFSDNLFLRVIYKDTNKIDVLSIVNDCKRHRNVLEVSTIKDNEDKDDIITKRYIDTHQSLNDVGNQNYYIEQFLQENKNLPIEQIRKVQKINELTNKSIVKQDTIRNRVWIPKYFTFSNMFSYGENITLDFEKYKGVYGIFAPNASGKSTLFDSILFTIFDKCSRTSKASEVMNNLSSTFYAKLVFEVDKVEYTIERKGKRDNKNSVKVDVDFYYFDEDNNQCSLNGDSRFQTNDGIRNVLGSYENFLLTTLSSQVNNSSFVEMGQTNRKELLSDFLEAGVFDDLYSVAKEEYKKINTLVKSHEKVDYELDITSYGDELDKIVYDQFDLQDEIDTLTKEKLGLEIDYISLRKSILPINEIKGDTSTLKNESNTILNKIEVIRQNIDVEEKNLEQTNIDLENLKKSICDIDIENVNSKVDEYNKLLNASKEAYLKSTYLQIEVDNLQDKVDKLEHVKYDVNCKFCMENIFVKDAIQAQEQLKDKKNKLASIKNEAISYESGAKYYSNYVQTKNFINEQNEKKSGVLEINQRVVNKLDNLRSTKIKLIERLDEIAKDLAYIESNENAIVSNITTNEQIAKTKKRLDDVKSKLIEKSNESVSLMVKKGTVQNKIDTLLKRSSEYKDLLEESEVYEQYISCINKNGIPQYIISKALPEIEEEVNSILTSLVDFRVIFTTIDKNIEVYIAYNDDSCWPIELTSGMERFLISLAIRIALINVSVLPRPNFLVIDEGFGVLDKGNLELIKSFFDYIKTQFSFVFIISHIDGMKDYVDKIIEIYKNDNKSYLQG